MSDSTGSTFHHHGLLWQVVSPSFWRLDPRHCKPGHGIDVNYDGSTWLLCLSYANGDVRIESYPTRDDAMAFIVQAQKRAK